MAKKVMAVMAVILLATCLLSGGCAAPDEDKVQSFKDMLKTSLNKNKEAAAPPQEAKQPVEETVVSAEQTQVKLYFWDDQMNKLVAEERNIAKVEGIARETLQELFKGPAKQGYSATVPRGTRLLDINIKPDGQCIIDISSEACGVASEKQEKTMVESITRTLGQFPAVKEVVVLVNGQSVDSIGGYIDVSKPLPVDPY